jgi:hypothetical protein
MSGSGIRLRGIEAVLVVGSVVRAIDGANQYPFKYAANLI